MRKRTSNRFGWRKVNEVGKKMRSLRKYHFGDNAVLIMKSLTKIAEKEKEKIKVLDFGCAEGTICLRETKPFIEYFGYDNDVENPKVAYHSLDEMKGCHFDAIVFSHVVEHLELDEMVSIMEWSLDRSDYIY